MYIAVYVGIQQYAWVYSSMRGYTAACVGIYRHTAVCVAIHRYIVVCICQSHLPVYPSRESNPDVITRQKGTELP